MPEIFNYWSESLYFYWIANHSLLLTLFIFTTTGIALPLLVEGISVNGGCEKSTLLCALPSQLGMSVAIFTRWSSRRQGTVRWRMIFLDGFVEMMGSSMNSLGLLLSGMR